jgi:acetyl esterase/lipase
MPTWAVAIFSNNPNQRLCLWLFCQKIQFQKFQPCVMFYWLLPVLWYSAFIAHERPLLHAANQPGTGPGGTEYLHDSVHWTSYAQKMDGYWLFEPAAPKPDSAHVVVFVHGYGGINPVIYGKWIKHLVRKGNIVIYPRYQLDMLIPRTPQFTENVATGVKAALEELGKEGHVKPIVSHLAFVGHSWGGVITANLCKQYQEYGIPQPHVAFLCAPGTSILKGGRLEEYGGMPPNLSLLIAVSDEDAIVGDEFALQVFKEAKGVKQRNLVRFYTDTHGTPPLVANHNQPYCMD